MVICRDRITVLFFLSCIVLCSCSVSKRIAKSAKVFIADSSLINAHTGISIYDAASNKYLFNYQGDKYFVPASNTKIPTCYAAMKYLGDSLVGLRYVKDDGYLLQGTGDPTFLHDEFKNQPVYDFLKSIAHGTEVDFCIDNWSEKHLGSGWSWDDYNESYMAERSPFPIYGNVVKFELKENRIKATPFAFDSAIIYLPGAYPDSGMIERKTENNLFLVRKSNSKFKNIEIPFSTGGYFVPIALLNDTLIPWLEIRELQRWFPGKSKTVYSQPTDSLLKPMMHRSDNFFAEQTLLMVSNEMLGVMNDEKIIDTLLKTDFKNLPQKPNWADGSGLSRYNLFTPQDFVFILNKMKEEFGMKRVQTIFPTGNTGTLEKRYKADSSCVFAKTGTLSGVVALSGFLYTKKNKLLIFSVLVNNHNGAATEVRNAIEKFLHNLRQKY